MTAAFFLGVKSSNPASYPHSADKVRMVCEVLVLLFTIIYIVAEIDQMIK